MTSSTIPPDTSTSPDDLAEDNNDATLVAEMGELATHVRLVKMEGRVYLCVKAAIPCEATYSRQP